MLLNEPFNAIQLQAAEAPGTLQGNGFQPDLCHHVLTPDVNVGRLAPIQGHEEEAIGTYPENGRHATAILSHAVTGFACRFTELSSAWHARELWVRLSRGSDRLAIAASGTIGM
jgi:hypothetical protein